MTDMAKVIAAIERSYDGGYLAVIDNLDSLVHETADSIASGINNEGIQGQVEWLVSQGVSLDHIITVSNVEVPE